MVRQGDVGLLVVSIGCWLALADQRDRISFSIFDYVATYLIWSVVAVGMCVILWGVGAITFDF